MADQLLTAHGREADSVTCCIAEPTERRPSFVHSSVEICGLQRGRILVESQSIHGCDAFSLHDAQILNDPRDSCSQGSKTISQLILGFGSISVLVSTLQELKHPYRTHIAGRCLSVEIVKSIPHALQRREREFVQSTEDSVLESCVRNEDGFAVLLTEEAKKMVKHAGVARHLGNDLNQHEQSFGFFAICLLVCLKSSNSNCCGTSAVRGLAEPVRDYTQNRSGHNSSAPCCNSPCLPVRNAAVPQPPTLAKRVNHAHSLIPLLTRGHSATRPQR